MSNTLFIHWKKQSSFDSNVNLATCRQNRTTSCLNQLEIENKSCSYDNNFLDISYVLSWHYISLYQLKRTLLFTVSFVLKIFQYLPKIVLSFSRFVILF